MKLEDIVGIGEKTLKLLNKKNISTIEELVSFYPINYQFYDTEAMDTGELQDKQNIVISGVITKDISEYRVRNGLLITNYFISDGKKEFKIVAWNQRHLRFTLSRGQKVKITGKYDKTKDQITQNRVEILSEDTQENNSQNILPIYSKINGLTDNKVQKIILKALNTMDDEQYKENLYKIHAPKSNQDITDALDYLKYKEFYEYYQKLQKLKNKAVNNSIDYKKNVYETDLNYLLHTLPFSLTADQEQVVNKLFTSLNSDQKTQSLILGDVGSGKTIIAIIISYLLAKKGYQIALMAPTEVLAKQLYDNFVKFLEFTDFDIELLTSSVKKAKKNQIKDKILVGLTKIVIGTHALIQEDVVFKNLALCIIDEQHRFGVEQRNTLVNKSLYKEFLYLSATPIPRTLAQSMFGVMDVLFIESKPKNRKPIITEIYTAKNKKDIFTILDEQLKVGNQAYVVGTTIEKTEIENLEDVQSLYENFKAYYKDKYEIGLIHGSQKSQDKDIIMQKFKDKEYNLLVATTVIEVGVDVSDATVIVVINAERFGLAQLHQLRGRVGRGDKQSYCLLYDKSSNDLSKERLELLKEHDNGFVLANKDLKLRGYGNFFGKEQSGYVDFKLFNYVEDYEIAQKVIEDIGNN